MALAALAALAGVHERTSWTTLHVVTGLPAPLAVRLDDGDPQPLAAGGHLELPVRAGARRVLVEAAGRPAEALDLVVPRGGLVDRPLVVVNPGGAATLVVEELAYGPPEPGRPPRPPELRFGEPCLTLEGIDYAFTTPLATVTTGD